MNTYVWIKMLCIIILTAMILFMCWMIGSSILFRTNLVRIGDIYKYCYDFKYKNPFDDDPVKYYISEVLDVQDKWVKYKVLESNMRLYKVGEIKSEETFWYVVNAKKIDYKER